MEIFQKSVINKHLASLAKDQVEKAYQKFKENFSPAKIEKIKQLKEEEYQDGFLRDLFVDVLGYSLKPDENYNLVREFKNQDDGRKADGAILKDEKAIAVIELKSTKTKDLKSITEQAFNYKNNQPDCKYVITSNFQKLRFYIDYANEYEEFDLFLLKKDEFERLYLILNTNSVFLDLPLKLKDETKFHEKEISEKLYNDYSDFKNKLFKNLIKKNPDFDKLTLFKKSQKLLDRFLFILFSEDSGLLPPNSISRIIKRYEILKEEDAYKPLYDIFKQYFGYMNIGRKGKNIGDDIPAYNGGLFYPDEILDSLKVDDDVMIDDLFKLSSFDFNTEVDVNILGHIFEHSLSEIEEITAEIEGTTTDKTKSKRKKDGVFYTPKYITQYIVENTIGTLCNEKRKELEIEEIEFDGTYRTKDGNLSAKGKKLYQKLKDYKDWLLSLKIVDPACGSGAFLNQGLNFLILEHKNIDDIIAELTNTALRLFDTDIAILENNLYGVDINEESIEIAKLSLWLHTAQKGRKLSILSNNIKCGNSLIDDLEVAGEKAFNWNKEYPEIFAKGGFDVVIGNPPYAYRNSIAPSVKEFFNENYKSIEGNFELYKFFIEKGINLINSKGIFSFITSSSFLIQKSFSKLRKIILDNTQIIELSPLGPGVFDDATVDTAIFILSKDNTEGYVSIRTPKIPSEIVNEPIKKVNTKRYYKNKGYVFDCQLSEDMFKMLDKVYSHSERLEDLFELGVGINTGYIRDLLVSDSKLDNRYHLMVPGSGISRYGKCNSTEWIMYDKDFVKSQGKLGRTLPEKRFFDNEKLLVVRTRNLSMPIRIVATFDSKEKYNLNRLSNIISKDGNSLFGLLGFLNSKFYNWLFSTKYLDYEIKPIYLKECPIVKTGLPLLKLSSKDLYNKTIEFENRLHKFFVYIKSNLNIEKLTNKLQNWHELEFVDFLKELNKAIKTTGIKPLSKSDEFEWMELFENKKAEAQTLKAEIESTDKEIDQMIYELYELTENEIKIVEESVS